MANKNDNKSLFLYTSLIFIVAVLLIILSFFGQTNMKKNMTQVDTEAANSGITERAAVLSEENKNLLEENNKLKTENQELTKKITTNDILLSANGYFSLGNNDKALEMLLAVNYDGLSVDQKIIYDNIKTAIDNAE